MIQHQKAGTMRDKIKLSIPQIISVVLITALISTATVLAATGTTDSPAAPGSTNSYTLEDIWNRLTDGSAGTQSTFTEPSVAPGTGTMHTINDIMGLAPSLDNTNAAGAADVFSGKTFWGLSGGEWGLQTGTYQRFTDHGDGTVTDNQTGLMWTKDATHGTAGTVDWFDANVVIGNLTTGGYTDWDMPDIWELFTLMDDRESNPCMPDGHPFTGVKNTYYWSNTFYEHYTYAAYYIRLSDCYVSYANKLAQYDVWPVRRP